jgi:hypothetical protein
MDLDSVLTSIQFAPHDRDSILALVPLLREKFAQIDTSSDAGAETRWMMKKLRPMALGNMPLPELAAIIREGGA